MKTASSKDQKCVWRWYADVGDRYVGPYKTRKPLIGDIDDWVDGEIDIVKLKSQVADLTAVVDDNFVSNGQIINCSGTRNRISITGINAAIKGVKGNRIRLSVYDDGNNLIGDLTGCIGETGLKENVLYRASGQFVEASVVEEAE